MLKKDNNEILICARHLICLMSLNSHNYELGTIFPSILFMRNSWSVHGPTLSKWENLSLTSEPVGERHVYRLLSIMLGTGCHSVTGSYYHYKNKLYFGCAAQMGDFSSLARDWTHAPLHWKQSLNYWTTELNQRNFSFTDAAFIFFWEQGRVSGHSGSCNKYHRPGSL